MNATLNDNLDRSLFWKHSRYCSATGRSDNRSQLLKFESSGVTGHRPSMNFRYRKSYWYGLSAWQDRFVLYYLFRVEVCVLQPTVLIHLHPHLLFTCHSKINNLPKASSSFPYPLFKWPKPLFPHLVPSIGHPSSFHLRDLLSTMYSPRMPTMFSEPSTFVEDHFNVWRRLLSVL